MRGVDARGYPARLGEVLSRCKRPYNTPGRATRAQWFAHMAHALSVGCFVTFVVELENPRPSKQARVFALKFHLSRFQIQKHLARHFKVTDTRLRGQSGARGGADGRGLPCALVFAVLPGHQINSRSSRSISFFLRSRTRCSWPANHPAYCRMNPRPCG